MTPNRAFEIAYVAHGAKGQKRADKKTPYIVHPKQVALNVTLWHYSFETEGLNYDLEDCLVAAYLHDVLEDTKITCEDLLFLGVTPSQLDIIVRLTKEDPSGKAPPSYYQLIRNSDAALLVHCADRCSNLDDAYNELIVPEPESPKRWANYCDGTEQDAIPMYVKCPALLHQLKFRIDKIARALPGALRRRQEVVNKKRVAEGLSTREQFEAKANYKKYLKALGTRT